MRTSHARVLFWGLCAAIAALALAPFRGFGVIDDRLDHACAFAALLALGGQAYPRLRLSSLLVGAVMAGAFMEVIQATPAVHRDADVWDWLAGVAGSAAAVMILALMRRQRAVRAAHPRRKLHDFGERSPSAIDG